MWGIACMLKPRAKSKILEPGQLEHISVCHSREMRNQQDVDDTAAELATANSPMTFGFNQVMDEV